MLLTASPDAVLGTIRSRCQRIDLRPLATDAVTEALTSRWEVPEAQARELASLSAGRLGWAVRAWEDPAVLETRDRRLERLTAAAEGGIEERFAYAAELANLLPQQRTAVRETLDLWAEWWLERLSARAEADSDDAPVEGPNRGDLLLAVREVLRTQDLLDRNANPRLALEALMLSLPRVPSGAVTGGFGASGRGVGRGRRQRRRTLPSTQQSTVQGASQTLSCAASARRVVARSRHIGTTRGRVRWFGVRLHGHPPSPYLVTIFREFQLRLAGRT